MKVGIRTEYACYFWGLYLETSSEIFDCGKRIPFTWNSSFLSFPNLIFQRDQFSHPVPMNASIVLWFSRLVTRSVIFSPLIGTLVMVVFLLYKSTGWVPRLRKHCPLPSIFSGRSLICVSANCFSSRHSALFCRVNVCAPIGASVMVLYRMRINI